uniref:D12 class N6 adenine-specific DNA methyltransferase n=1 Tax=Mycobacterium riyadhense TaxID=486698 RepID=A0A653EW65_9MYCO|nr:D12 class N6 adenine-specific DNA methyltransferase [Mycobacterium riyadhense]
MIGNAGGQTVTSGHRAYQFSGTAPPMPYYGGKTRVATRISTLLPAHEHYVEPFAGSLSVLLAKPSSRMETATTSTVT